MKALWASIAIVVCLAISGAAIAAGDKDKDKGDRNSGSDTNGNDNNQNKQTNHPDNNSNHKGTNSVLSSSPNKITVNRENNVDRKNNLGDSGFDKHGIGPLDEKKYSDRKDNDWRYKHWGSEWWYWLPGGYWSYWRDGGWHRYYPDSYVDVYQTANGPYYEDQGGFYTLQGNRKVYDPQIRREASPGSNAPGAPQG